MDNRWDFGFVVRLWIVIFHLNLIMTSLLSVTGMMISIIGMEIIRITLFERFFRLVNSYNSVRKMEHMLFLWPSS